MPYCAVCKKTIVGGDMKIVRVPKDSAKKQLWENALNQSFGADSRICELHFEPSDFKLTTTKKKTAKRRLLMPNALPKKVLRGAENLVSESHKNCSSQTDSEAIEAGILLENIRLKNEVLELQRDNTRLLKELDGMNTLTQALKRMFTETQLAKLKSGGQKKMWNSEDISYGLCLYAAGPRAYHHLYQKGFPLPSKSTLQRWLRKVQNEPGSLENVDDSAIDFSDLDCSLDGAEELTKDALEYVADYIIRKLNILDCESTDASFTNVDAVSHGGLKKLSNVFLEKIISLEKLFLQCHRRTFGMSSNVLKHLQNTAQNVDLPIHLKTFFFKIRIHLLLKAT